MLEQAADFHRSALMKEGSRSPPPSRDPSRRLEFATPSPETRTQDAPGGGGVGAGRAGEGGASQLESVKGDTLGASDVSGGRTDASGVEEEANEGRVLMQAERAAGGAEAGAGEGVEQGGEGFAAPDDAKKPYRAWEEKDLNDELLDAAEASQLDQIQRVTRVCMRACVRVCVHV